MPILWFHIPCTIIVHGTLNGPQNDIGNYLGPCSRGFYRDHGAVYGDYCAGVLDERWAKHGELYRDCRDYVWAACSNLDVGAHKLGLGV